MKPSLFDKLATLRAARIDVIDAQEIAPRIRNHLIQLFRAAHEVEPGLTGVKVGMGTAFPTGDYHSLDEDQSSFLCSALEWDEQTHWQPVSDKVGAFFTAIREYDTLAHGRANDLPDIDDITLDDIVTTRTKKAAIHRSRGLRARLANGL